MNNIQRINCDERPWRIRAPTLTVPDPVSHFNILEFRIHAPTLGSLNQGPILIFVREVSDSRSWVPGPTFPICPKIKWMMRLFCLLGKVQNTLRALETRFTLLKGACYLLLWRKWWGGGRGVRLQVKHIVLALWNRDS